ncbi:MAG: methionine aminopeptidase [Candidatus Campbellbacteria bacterium]
MTSIKTPEDIALIREAGKRLACIVQRVSDTVAPGISTQELNDVCERLIREGGDTPAFLNYRPDGASRPYPATLCVSINDEAVHGIPDPKRILKEGDIVSLDAGLIHQGRIADMCVTVPVGNVDAQAQRLIDVTKKAMDIGIAAARGGAYVGDIGRAIEPYVQKEGFEVVADLGGHGVGLAVHETPHVFHIARKGKGDKLEPGMVITVEPTIAEEYGDVILGDDGFTYVTADGSRCAQWEHTILITDGAPEILTVQ